MIGYDVDTFSDPAEQFSVTPNDVNVNVKESKSPLIVA